ncbi:MAG: 1-acyl-sn-glycerol-3-phosphate acyltransferase [Flavobacteriales bacterium]|nr:1-acyl-sn-glycerol-3-phosphate acyltransferase [Flavobacteriales bacterium]
MGGWTIQYDVDKSINKCVVIGAPHTSNWDFVYALPALHFMGIENLRYLIKKEFFFWPFTWLFKATGGIPVDRSKRNDLTTMLKSLLESKSSLYLLFPPEGTRSRVERWKTGFYYTAIDTQLPIVLGFMDYEKRVLGFGDVLYPTGDFNKDMAIIEKFYAEKGPKNPANYNPIIFKRK